MSISYNPSMVTDSLALYLDAANIKSLVGEPTINILYTNGNVDWAVYGLTGTISLSTVTTNQVYRITNATASTVAFRIAFNSTKLVNGLSYNLSYKYKFISGGSTFTMTDWCDTSLGNVVNTDFELYKYSSAFGTRSTYDSTYRFMDFNISANTVVEFYDIQLEQKQYATPFVAGTRNEFYDISGNNNTATLASFPISPSTSPKYLSFNGSGKRATLATPFGQNNQTTINIGYRRTEASSSSTWRTLLSDISANFHHLISQQSSRNLGIWDGAFKDFGYNPPQDSKFHIYSVVYTSGSSATLFVDGVQGNTISTTLNLNTNKIGSIGNWNGGDYWSGDISFLQIYSKGLSASEIKQNYDALRGRYGL